MQHSTPFLGHLQSGPHLQSAPAQPLHTQIQQSPVVHLVQLSPHWQSGPHLQLAVEEWENNDDTISDTHQRTKGPQKHAIKDRISINLPHLQGPAGTQHSTPFLGHLQSGPHLQSAPAQPLHTHIQQSPVVHLSPHWQSGPHLQLAVEATCVFWIHSTKLINTHKNRAHCGYLPLLQGAGLSAIFLSLLRVLREIWAFFWWVLQLSSSFTDNDELKQECTLGCLYCVETFSTRWPCAKLTVGTFALTTVLHAASGTRPPSTYVRAMPCLDS